MNTPLIDEHAAHAAGCCGICGEAVEYGQRDCPGCREMMRDVAASIDARTMREIKQRVRDVRAAKWN